jgi:hypothetical protein
VKVNSWCEFAIGIWGCTLQCLHRPKKQNLNFMVGTDCFLVHIYWSLGKNFVQLESNVSHFVYLDWALELFIVLSGCNHVSINLRSTEFAMF